MLQALLTAAACSQNILLVKLLHKKTENESMQYHLKFMQVYNKSTMHTANQYYTYNCKKIIYL